MRLGSAVIVFSAIEFEVIVFGRFRVAEVMPAVEGFVQLLFGLLDQPSSLPKDFGARPNSLVKVTNRIKKLGITRF